MGKVQLTNAGAGELLAEDLKLAQNCLSGITGSYLAMICLVKSFHLLYRKMTTITQLVIFFPREMAFFYIKYLTENHKILCLSTVFILDVNKLLRKNG